MATAKALKADGYTVVLKQILVGRFCEPEEVANVIRFLVFPLSSSSSAKSLT